LRLGLSPQGAPMGHAEVTAADWIATARRHSMGAGFAGVLGGLAAWAEPAIDQVSRELPESFPSSVSGPVFEGLHRSARLLA